MYNNTRPHSCVKKELAMRIFRKLGLDTEVLAKAQENDALILKEWTTFIYPSVRYALGLSGKRRGRKIVCWQR